MILLKPYVYLAGDGAAKLGLEELRAEFPFSSAWDHEAV